MMMAHGPWPSPYILWDQDKKEKSLLATRDPPREMGGSSPHTGGGSSSSGDEAEDPRRRAAIDSVVAALDFSTSLSKPPTKPISSPPQSHEANDEENKPKSHAFKLYQIKARPFFFSLSLSSSLDIWSEICSCWENVNFFTQDIMKSCFVGLKQILRMIPISKRFGYSVFNMKIWNSFSLCVGWWSLVICTRSQGISSECMNYEVYPGVLFFSILPSTSSLFVDISLERKIMIHIAYWRQVFIWLNIANLQHVAKFFGETDCVFSSSRKSAWWRNLHDKLPRGYSVVTRLGDIWAIRPLKTTWKLIFGVAITLSREQFPLEKYSLYLFSLSLSLRERCEDLRVPKRRGRCKGGSDAQDSPG